MKTIILYGLRRSGNHFLISNILQHFNNTVHINNCLDFSFDNYINYKNIDITTNRSSRVFTGFKNADLVVISMENKTIDESELEKFKNIDDCYIVLLLRNPYNNLASAWREYILNPRPKRVKPEQLEQIHSLWIDYANKYLAGGMVNVLYDSFVESEEYRRRIMTSIGITLQKVNLNQRIKWQRSSYSDTSKKRKIWGKLEDSNYAGDPEFIKLFNGGEHEELWNRIQMTEQLVISLGGSCDAANQLKRIGVNNIHYFFDFIWNEYDGLKAVTRIIKNDFEHFDKVENYTTTTTHPILKGTRRGPQNINKHYPNIVFMHHDATKPQIIESLNRKIERTQNILSNPAKKVFIYYRHYHWSFNLCSDLDVLINESLEFCEMYKNIYNTKNFYLLSLIVYDPKFDTDKINTELSHLRKNENENLKFDFLYRRNNKNKKLNQFFIQSWDNVFEKYNIYKFGE